MWQVPRRLLESVPPQHQQPIRPAPPVRVVPLELDYSLYLCNHTTPGYHSLANAACAFYHNGSDAPHTTTLHILCSTASVSPITLRFRPDGTQGNFVCDNIFVRYISMKCRPTFAEFIPATTAFPCPNWPQRHPAKMTGHAPTAPPPTARATTTFLLRLQLHLLDWPQQLRRRRRLPMQPPSQPWRARPRSR